MRFRKGFKIMNRALYNPPKQLQTVAANKEKRWVQNKQITLPTNNIPIFLCSVPFNGKVKEIKRKLNITSVNIVSLLIRKNDKNMKEITSPSNNTRSI
jgi:hypothetical protein